MTIEEIKSVSIVLFLESQGYHHVDILKENYWYLSPFRTEASPSFNVSPKNNLWNDFGAGEGGNLINLVQKMNPSWNNHEVLTYLEQKIKEHHLQYSVHLNLPLSDSQYMYSAPEEHLICVPNFGELLLYCL